MVVHNVHIKKKLFIGSRKCSHYHRHKSKDSDKSRYLAAKEEFTNETVCSKLQLEMFIELERQHLNL